MSRNPEFLVVGGGICGLTLAVELARSGRSVTCVDAGIPGGTCSTSSLGLAYPISPLTAPTHLSLLSVRATQDYPQFIDELERRSECAVGFWRTGLVQIATSEDEALSLATTRNRYGEIGIFPRLLPHQDSLFESLDLLVDCHLAAALHFPTAYHVDAQLLLHALLNDFRRSGGMWMCPVKMVDLIYHGSTCVGIQSSAGRLHADNTILCNGASMQSTLAALGICALQPVRGQAMLLDTNLVIPVVLYTAALDIVPRPNGKVLIGSTIEIGKDTIENTEAGIDEMLFEARRIFGNGPRLQVEERWCGIRPESLTGCPIMGPTPITGLNVFGGMYRNGVFLSPMLAQEFAAYLLGRQPNLDMKLFALPVL